MKHNDLDLVLGNREHKPIQFDTLMPKRIQNILLVSSLYDSYTFVQDGRLTDLLFSEYLDLNLRYAPHVDRVSTAQKALRKLESDNYDLVISMLRVGDMNVREFGLRVRRIHPGLPVILLAFNNRELSLLEEMGHLPGIDQIFVWSGDARLFLAIVKYIEDRLNVLHDAQAAGVQTVILIEDSIRFYSAYLPMLYTEIMEQTHSLMSDGLNQMQKLVRQHARPKILLATNYKEGLEYYSRYREFLMGVIIDAAFPRDGKVDAQAGIDFATQVKKEQPDLAVLVQSSDQDNELLAHGIGAAFINKRSPSLLQDVRAFMKAELGFGDFIFRRPDSSIVTTANDLRSFVEGLKIIPDESLLYHGRRKDFSTWLLARTEFNLAKAIRSKRMTEFDSPGDFRKHLISALNVHRNRTRAGIVSEFSSGTFEGESGFVRIGSGSLGGKGRGLAFINTMLETYRIDTHIPKTRIFVPPTAVLATGVFDQFVKASGLASVVLGESSDKEMVGAVLDARLPAEVIEQLRVFLSRVRYPLAVRSSSLLEDASYQPFAGIYRTYMIPNNHESPERRLQELLSAVKLVYASTFMAQAKSYLEHTPNRLEEEKMAVVIQQIVGRRREEYVYPDVAGVARSHNAYSVAGLKPEDGIVSIALGLGKTVVDGGRALRFSPRRPMAMSDLWTPRDYLNNAQREFFALNLYDPGPNWRDCAETSPNLVSLGLDMAAKHGIFDIVGSVFSPKESQLHHGSTGPGVKLITMAGLLKDDQFNLAAGIDFLLKIGSASLSCPVEIEFAANIRKDRDPLLELAFLQIRPMVIDSGGEDIDISNLAPENAICISRQALGHGEFQRVQDLVYVRQDTFNRALTQEIADEIGTVNEVLRQAERPYVLIGPGRWGSADRSLGIPVLWSQISHVSCIVETDLKDLRVSPSQGSHFFQNITSFGVGYFTVNFGESAGVLDMQWLDSQDAKTETDHVRHLRFEHPLDIAVDSRSGIGVIMKPNLRAPRRAD
ncbi:MAG: PEP/pyruvate-binding domain-containing protein [Myxococcota bacterium]|nr:PEP/pyruvate-binding domain-containing protein [Myxococcota bacterium]